MERNYYNERQQSRRYQPNSDRLSRWSEDDDRMDRDDRYSREDSEQDRFFRNTRGAPYSTYSSNRDWHPSDRIANNTWQSSDSYRDQNQYFNRSTPTYSEQTPYQNFGRSPNFSDRSHDQSYSNHGGTQSYSGNAQGYSSQAGYGTPTNSNYGSGSSYGTGSGSYQSGSYNTPSYNSSSLGYGSAGNQGYSSAGSYNSDSNYGSRYQGSQGLSGNSQGYNSDQYRSQGSNSSNYGDYQGSQGSSRTTPWSSDSQNQSSDRYMSSKSGKAPKGYKRSDDRIKEEISDLFTSHHEVDPSEVEIKVSSGEVTLTGSVENRQEKRLTEDLASSISGVSEVHNQLRVNTKSGTDKNRFQDASKSQDSSALKSGTAQNQSSQSSSVSSGGKSAVQ